MTEDKIKQAEREGYLRGLREAEAISKKYRDEYRGLDTGSMAGLIGCGIGQLIQVAESEANE